jgi:hypothetical protein
MKMHYIACNVPHVKQKEPSLANLPEIVLQHQWLACDAAPVYNKATRLQEDDVLAILHPLVYAHTPVVVMRHHNVIVIISTCCTGVRSVVQLCNLMACVAFVQLFSVCIHDVHVLQDGTNCCWPNCY